MSKKEIKLNENNNEIASSSNDTDKRKGKERTIVDKALPFIYLASVLVLSKTIMHNRAIIEENKKLIQINNFVKEYYYSENLTEKELEDIMIGGMINGLPDKYSLYMNTKSMKEHEENMKGNYDGIGINISDAKIEEVVPNSPADKKGLLKGDRILEINGIKLVDPSDKNYKDTMLEIANSLKSNKKNEFVVNRDGKDLKYAIEKGNYTTKVVDYKMLDDKIGFLKIESFSKNIHDEIDKAIKLFKDKKAKGIIIDLRYNPGGEKETAEYIADALMKDVVIGTMKFKEGVKEDEVMKTDSDALEVPMVVLTNGSTASASEILAGAIVTNKKGITIGTRTYGKGTALGEIKFKDGSGMMVSMGEIILGNGEKIEGKGIEPSIKENDESKHIDLALEYLNNKINEK